MRYILMTIFLFASQCNGQIVDETALKAMKSEEYTITNIDSTYNFYLYKGKVNKTDPILLVVDKKSKQLKGRTVKVGETYIFKAYRLYDLFAFNAHMCHNVDNKEIWCHNDKIDLRFTDGMGNEIFEDD
ncbi:MAG: hypothetical protein WDZ45_01455 [Flavobacteriaceae bacterium]